MNQPTQKIKVGDKVRVKDPEGNLGGIVTVKKIYDAKELGRIKKCAIVHWTPPNGFYTEQTFYYDLLVLETND